MMIGDNHIDSKTLCVLDAFDITSPTVYGDDEFHILFMEFIDEIVFESVSVLYPIWESVATLHTDSLEKVDQDRSRSRTIDIVVSKHYHSLSLFFCLFYSRYGLVHISE